MDTPDKQDVASSGASSADSNETKLAQPPKTMSTFTDIYLGPTGLRAGWRFFLYLVMVVCGVIAVMTYARLGGPGLHSKNKLWDMAISEFIFCAVAFVPAFIMAKVEKRSFGAYGLAAKYAFRKQFWIGILWGLVSFTVLMLTLRIIGVFQFGALAQHGLKAVRYGIFYAALFLLVGFTEEFLLRGYSQFTLAQGIGFWPAAIALSVVFGAIHISNQGEAWIGIAGVIMVGLIFCLTLRRTGSLWFAVGMHAAWDWAESFVYSVADSGNMAPGHLFHSSFHGSRWLTGGTVGPEGSVLIFILLPAIWILFDRTHPAVRSSSSASN
jgi:uncharacterized protein